VPGQHIYHTLCCHLSSLPFTSITATTTSSAQPTLPANLPTCHPLTFLHHFPPFTHFPPLSVQAKINALQAAVVKSVAKMFGKLAIWQRL